MSITPPDISTVINIDYYYNLIQRLVINILLNNYLMNLAFVYYCLFSLTFLFFDFHECSIKIQTLSLIGARVNSKILHVICYIWFYVNLSRWSCSLTILVCLSRVFVRILSICFSLGMFSIVTKYHKRNSIN